MPLRLLSAGSNGSNQLAHSADEDTSRFERCLVPAAFDRVQGLAFGANHTVGLVRVVADDDPDGAAADGGERWQVWGSGDGRLGQLGERWLQASHGFQRLVLPPPPVAGAWVPTRVACGWTTTFIAFAPRPADVATSPSSPVAAARQPTMSLLLALGSNDFSELGAGARAASAAAASRRHHWHVFDGEAIHHFRAGPRHAMVVLGQGGIEAWRVLGWGAARHGQLAAPSTPDPRDDARPAPKHPVTIDAPTLVLSSDGQSGEHVPDVALGFAHSVLRFPDTGVVLRLGAPSNVALHEPPRLPHVLGVHSTWHHLVYLDRPSTLVVQGRPSSLNAAFASHTLEADDPVRAVAAGSEHVVVLTAARRVWGWGWNEHGNLGDGSTDDCTVPKQLWLEGAGARIEGVWAGCGTSWILAAD